MIHLPGELLREIREHAERDYPHECCGALLGHVESTGGAASAETRVVAKLHAAENRRDSDAASRRFLITADDYRAIENAARAQSFDVIGFYHSHPDHPARPSEYDREHALPWYSYVIVSVRAGRAGENPFDVTSWILDDDRHAFHSEPIAIPRASAPARASGSTG